MKCPSCGAASPEGALECASCGIIFAKYAEKRRRERDEATAALAQMDVAPNAAANHHLGRWIAGVLLCGWAAIMAYFIAHQVSKPSLRAQAAAAAAAPSDDRTAPAPAAAAPTPTTSAAAPTVSTAPAAGVPISSNGGRLRVSVP